jgi:hypothetical protein
MHLPWKGFIHALQRVEQINRKLISLNQHSKIIRDQVIPINHGTLVFIGSFDYDIPREYLSGLTALQICQIIDGRIEFLQQRFIEQTKEIQLNQPAFLGHYIRPESIFPIDVAKYTVHYSDLILLCVKINKSEENKNNPQYREELLEHIKIMDLSGIFKRPISTYTSSEMCHILLGYLENLFAPRERSGSVDTRYL